MAGLDQSRGLIVGLALALLMAPAGGVGARARPAAGASAPGIHDSERPLGEISTAGDPTLLTYAATGEGAASGDEFKACDQLGNHARRSIMYSDGLKEAVLGGEGALRFANSKEDCESGTGPGVWMPADQLETAEAPEPTSSARVLASGLAWTGLGLLLSCTGPFMARWWH